MNVFGLWPKTRHLEALAWAFIVIYQHFLTFSQMKQWLIITKKLGPQMHHQQISKQLSDESTVKRDSWRFPAVLAKMLLQETREAVIMISAGLMLASK